MKKLPLILVAFAIGATLFVAALRKQNAPSPALDILRQQYTRENVPSVDHAKLPSLQKRFSSAQELTRTCISCHTERHNEVMQSSHWNWEREEYIEGRGIRAIGKKNILNNFCIGISSNEESCNKCHIGYNWTDSTFNFSDAENVDCLSCHDNSNTYVKGEHGLPEAAANLATIAQRVGRPMRTNCGACHFYGGGGNNVKHGDLEESLFDPGRDVDVHMSSDGVNMQCVACHTAENHKMLGKMYSVSSMNRNRSSCEQCHTDTPHSDDVLNEHTMKVACQSCHIPEYAKVNSTKLTWDWSTAGKLKNGEPYEVDDSLGNHSYMSIKGTFTWGRNLRPEYIWFNGTAGHYLMGDTTSLIPIRINRLFGDYNDRGAKIIPVKIHRARQPYDPINKTLIQPKLYAPEKGAGAFWKDFDWGLASEEGMKAVHQPYSGSYTFVETEMTWPVNHMVSPKAKTVTCTECHNRTDSRLAGLRDFYMPGRDYSATIDTIGIGAMLAALVGIIIHASARALSKRKNGRKEA